MRDYMPIEKFRQAEYGTKVSGSIRRNRFFKGRITFGAMEIVWAWVAFVWDLVGIALTMTAREAAEKADVAGKDSLGG
jgi:preprotein translocase subunit SecG